MTSETLSTVNGNAAFRSVPLLPVTSFPIPAAQAHVTASKVNVDSLRRIVLSFDALNQLVLAKMSSYLPR